MASSSATLLQLACISLGIQASSLFQEQRIERNIPVSSSMRIIAVPRLTKRAGDKSKLESSISLANVLLNSNPHRMGHRARSRSRSKVKISPLIKPSVIVTSLVAPAYAFAEDVASQKDSFSMDDLAKEALELSISILQGIKYIVEHAGDLTIVAVLLFFVSRLFVSPASQGRPPDQPQFFKPFEKLKNQQKEFLEITRLNEKLESFDFSFQKAVVSEAAAMRQKLKRSFNRRFGAEIASFNLDTKVLEDISKLEKDYHVADAVLRGKLNGKLNQMRSSAVEMSNSSNMMDGMMNAEGRLKGEVATIQAERFELETKFLSGLSKFLSSEQASRIKEIFKDNELPGNVGGTLEAVASLENIAASALAESKHVWVLKFDGDVFASQAATLRQEITALLRVANATRGDEVLLVLNTGGGTVSGYGLAAAQLQRIKKAGINLTVSVEQVAASGGYLMACVADKLIASPFAVLGSIGVITEQPNVYERLKKEGVSFSTITAGKYKRTLTPTKKLEEADKAKLQEDIERILFLFKGFVAESRPGLDIDKIATGETWLGPDALEQGLVDGLSTVDELLTDFIDHGAEVYSIKYKEQKSPLEGLIPQGAQGMTGFSSPGDWRELALSLFCRLIGLRTDTVIPARASGSFFPSGASQEDILAAVGADDYERELMLRRPLGEVDPLLRWKGGKSTRDLWHGL